MRKRKECERYCKYCNKPLERKRFNGRLEDYSVFTKRKYCDKECMRKDWLQLDKIKENWSNSHSTARKANELILHRIKCEICGSTKNLDIHHKDRDYTNNNLDNLQCLCRSCHNKIHRVTYCPICGKKARRYGYCEKHGMRYKKHKCPLFHWTDAQCKECIKNGNLDYTRCMVRFDDE